MRPITRLVLAAVALLPIGGGCAASASSPSAGFARCPTPLGGYHLFDLGAADVDGDGHLDLYSSNHYAAQAILRGDGRGGFASISATRWLAQDPAWPGLEDRSSAPAPLDGVLQIYWANGRLHLSLRDAGGTPNARGQLIFHGKIAGVESEPADSVRVEVIARPTGDGGTLSAVDFDLLPNGSLEIEPDLVGAPVQVTLHPPFPLDSIRVGAEGLTPPERSFVIALRDRHGMAWADMVGDPSTDVLIVRGGLKGRLLGFPTTFRDELLERTPAGFEDRAEAASLHKGGARSRQVTLADVNGDGRLDVYVSCIGQTRNQLHLRQADGSFEEVAAAAGVDELDGGHAEWLDLNGDRRPDLFYATRLRFRVYFNQGGTFRLQQDLANPGHWIHGIAVADLDGDADLDIYAASPRRSSVLRNDGGTFTPLSPADLGLPATALHAQWVDFDLDGQVDLYAIPGGLFRRREPSGFEETGLLRLSGAASEARAVWLDADGDGDRDVLWAVRRDPLSRMWETACRRNDVTEPSGRSASGGAAPSWLTVDVVGSPGNREALGARVTLKSTRGVQTTEVGHADSTHDGAGQYRLYFGLGGASTAERLTIEWPDGARRRLTHLPANRGLTIFP